MRRTIPAGPYIFLKLAWIVIRPRFCQLMYDVIRYQDFFLYFFLQTPAAYVIMLGFGYGCINGDTDFRSPRTAQPRTSTFVPGNVPGYSNMNPGLHGQPLVSGNAFGNTQIAMSHPFSFSSNSPQPGSSGFIQTNIPGCVQSGGAHGVTPQYGTALPNSMFMPQGGVSHPMNFNQQTAYDGSIPSGAFSPSYNEMLRRQQQLGSYSSLNPAGMGMLNTGILS